MSNKHMPHVYNDGGRAAAGRKGSAGDCVCRSIAIVAQLPYLEVYDRLADIMARTPKTKRRNRSVGKRSASNGVYTKSKLFKDYMAELGFRWIPTMQIGSGCKVHLAAGELPMGRIIARVTRHYTAVIDGVINDTHDPQRDGSTWFTYHPDGKVTSRESGGRCVYGYWTRD